MYKVMTFKISTVGTARSVTIAKRKMVDNNLQNVNNILQKNSIKEEKQTLIDNLLVKNQSRCVNKIVIKK